MWNVGVQNDETRIPNDEGMLKVPNCSLGLCIEFQRYRSYWDICHCSFLRHSCLVIRHLTFARSSNNRATIFRDASFSTRFVPSHVSYPPSSCCSGVGR